MAANCKETLGFGQDTFTSYVKLLLEQDERRRRESLESLSKYEMQALNKGSPAVQPTAAQPVAATSMPSTQLKQGISMEPAIIDLPPGLYNRAGPAEVQAKVKTPTKWQRAAQLHKVDSGSKLDEEATDADSNSSTRYAEVDSDTPLSRVVSPNSDFPLSRVTTPPLVPLPQAGKEPNPTPSPTRPEDARNLRPLLEKALLNHTPTGMPPEAVVEARRVLTVIAEQANSAKTTSKAAQEHEATKWLYQTLAKQQEASIQKLAKLFSSAASEAAEQRELAMRQSLASATLAAMSGRLPGGATPCQPVLPPGLNAAGNAAMPMNWPRMDVRAAAVAQAAQAAAGEHSYMGANAGTSQWWGMQGSPMGQAAPNRAVRAAAQVGADSASSVQPTGETLRMHLRSLIKIDSNRILIVRKINRLGFASPDLLEQHYSWYGKVERVLVAHSRVKSSALNAQMGKQLTSRLRPSGLGFVVMSKPEEAEAILADGTEQIVCGAVIRVQQFERRVTDMEEGLDLDLNIEEGC